MRSRLLVARRSLRPALLIVGRTWEGWGAVRRRERTTRPRREKRGVGGASTAEPNGARVRAPGSAVSEELELALLLVLLPLGPRGERVLLAPEQRLELLVREVELALLEPAAHRVRPRRLELLDVVREQRRGLARARGRGRRVDPARGERRAPAA